MLRPLPPRAMELLEEVAAPPRLIAHLRAVHDVAAELVAWAAKRGLSVDADAVLFGAATHDIGKALHPGELSGPGSEHEHAGRDLLLAKGIAPELAKYAANHSTPSAESTLDELLVSLADTVWKGHRRVDLEDLVVAVLAAESGREVWDEFLELDTLLTDIADGADERLAYQMQFPVTQKPVTARPAAQK
ncbi:metal dependent phophohydrolase [Catenulispora acidiphila DSM 44928]|uniref:Metal dependent phophohydrolase n=1 Tax=Catenulispora acidiphila (strain DSM 44928 / JCM 14897 / NBRC 102108 / NRRL B-24433 / ID139908) TaxID=479433 RepID=C7PW12_CATAD|nr:metal dependent phophohydrolase [Catenulispora acidiphila DSM 44928]